MVALCGKEEVYGGGASMEVLTIWNDENEDIFGFTYVVSHSYQALEKLQFYLKIFCSSLQILKNLHGCS